MVGKECHDSLDKNSAYIHSTERQSRTAKGGTTVLVIPFLLPTLMTEGRTLLADRNIAADVGAMKFWIMMSGWKEAWRMRG